MVEEVSEVLPASVRSYIYVDPGLDQVMVHVAVFGSCRGPGDFNIFPIPCSDDDIVKEVCTFADSGIEVAEDDSFVHCWDPWERLVKAGVEFLVLGCCIKCCCIRTEYRVILVASKDKSECHKVFAYSLRGVFELVHQFEFGSEADSMDVALIFGLVFAEIGIAIALVFELSFLCLPGFTQAGNFIIIATKFPGDNGGMVFQSVTGGTAYRPTDVPGPKLHPESVEAASARILLISGNDCTQ
eukprot:g45347.t1